MGNDTYQEHDGPVEIYIDTPKLNLIGEYSWEN